MPASSSPPPPDGAPPRPRRGRWLWRVAGAFGALVVLLAAIAGGTVWWAEREYRKPGPLTEARIVIIPKGAGLDDIVLLEEHELREGVRLALRTTHNLAEGAGAASLAAASARREALAGRTVVCVMSGGNIDRATLARIIGANRGL